MHRRGDGTLETSFYTKVVMLQRLMCSVMSLLVQYRDLKTGVISPPVIWGGTLTLGSHFLKFNFLPRKLVSREKQFSRGLIKGM